MQDVGSGGQITSGLSRFYSFHYSPKFRNCHAAKWTAAAYIGWPSTPKDWELMRVLRQIGIGLAVIAAICAIVGIVALAGHYFPVLIIIVGVLLVAWLIGWAFTCD